MGVSSLVFKLHPDVEILRPVAAQASDLKADELELELELANQLSAEED